MTQKYRSVLDVIKQILVEIPDSECNLKMEITKYYESLWNKAPETLKSRETWFPFQVMLSKNILPLDDEWKYKVLSIFNGV